jgi:hypothetical protein
MSETDDLLLWMNEQHEPLELTAAEFERLLRDHYEMLQEQPQPTEEKP